MEQRNTTLPTSFVQYNHKKHCCNVRLNIMMKRCKYRVIGWLIFQIVVEFI